MECQDEMDEMESQDMMEPKEDKDQGEALVCRDQRVCKLVQLLGYLSCFSSRVGDTLNYHLFGNKATKFDFIHQTVTHREVRMGWV